MRGARAAVRSGVCVVLALALSSAAAAAQAKPAPAAQKPPSQATQKPPAKTAPGKAAPQVRKPLPSRPVMLPASRRPGRPGSFEFSAAAQWLGPAGAGSADARLTENQAGGAGRGFTWFSARGEYASSAGGRATIGYNVTRTFAVEAGVAYSPSSIRFVVSDDSELGSGFTSPGQRLSEYFFDGAVLVHLAPLAFAKGRARPFILGGGGYLRQLHSGKAVVETGQVFYAGGGVKYWLAPRARGLVRAFGVRIDGRLCVRSGGWNLGKETTLSPAASAGLLAAF